MIWICRSIRKLERVWEGMDISCLGFRRTDVMAVIPKYLDCGDLHMAFARARCDECGYEYLLGFSCKRRQFCPSCYQKRVIESGEWLLSNSDLVCVFSIFKSLQSDHGPMPTRIQHVLQDVLTLCLAAISVEIEILHDIQPDCGFVMALSKNIRGR